MNYAQHVADGMYCDMIIHTCAIKFTLGPWAITPDLSNGFTQSRHIPTVAQCVYQQYIWAHNNWWTASLIAQSSNLPISLLSWSILWLWSGTSNCNGILNVCESPASILTSPQAWCLMNAMNYVDCRHCILSKYIIRLKLSVCSEISCG